MKADFRLANTALGRRRAKIACVGASRTNGWFGPAHEASGDGVEVIGFELDGQVDRKAEPCVGGVGAKSASSDGARFSVCGSSIRLKAPATA